MAAPRKWTNAQRAEMFRLFEAGKTPTEIVRLCAAGTAGTKPFVIPRRTCHEIVTRMATEAEQTLPSTLLESDDPGAVQRFPLRIASIIDSEIARLETRQKQRGLSSDDFDRLSKAASLSFTLHKRLNPRGAANTGSANGNAQPRKSTPPPESPIVRLAREERERQGVEDRPASARACQSSADEQPEARAKSHISPAERADERATIGLD